MSNRNDELKDDLTDDQEDSYVDALADDLKESESKKTETSEDDTDEVVDKVVKEEGDRLLKSDDEALERQFEPPKGSKSLKDRIKNAAVYWWEHKTLRYGTFALVFLAISASVLVPATRYFLLNTAGVRVQSSMTIVDSQTGLPLKNIPVRLQGQEIRTDDDGYVGFTDLKLGSNVLIVEKLGYAQYEKNLTLGWGSNPLGPQPLTATGTQFTFVLGDWLSGQPVVDAEASSGEDIAQADEDGRIILTVGELDDETEAVIMAEGYREVRVRLADVAEEQNVTMVPGKKHVFVSNRTGKYDLYKIDVDGTNEEVLIEATGQEREIPHVQPHQSENYAAYISTRDGVVNSGGFILDGLFIVDVNTGAFERVTRSEKIQIVGWTGNKLVYTAVTEGVSAANPERSRVFSYDLETGEKFQLATSNYFNDVKLVDDKVYYSVSSFAVPLSAAKLFSISADGENKETVVDMQVWNIVRASFDTLHFRAVDGSFDTRWLTQEKQGDVETLEGPPVVQNSRYYSTSPNGEQALWVDQRDGKGVLLKYVVSDGAEDAILTAPGLSEPVYWLNDRDIVYRIATSEETADYIISLDGGEPQKIADVIGNRSRYFY